METVNWKHRKIVEDGCGGVIYKVIDRENSPLENVEIAMCIFAPGEISQAHFHEKMEEIYFVLEGEGEIKINGTLHRLSVEDAVALPTGAVHQVKNTSQENVLRFLAINSPAWNPQDMIQIRGEGGT